MTGGTSFRVEEASIGNIQAAFKAGVTNARDLTQAFLDRIQAYDRQGPALWFIQMKLSLF